MDNAITLTRYAMPLEVHDNNESSCSRVHMVLLGKVEL
jgi:hypothetical protein